MLADEVSFKFGPSVFWLSIKLGSNSLKNTLQKSVVLVSNHFNEASYFKYSFLSE